MRSATSISANAMRSFSLGVSRPGSDMVRDYHGLNAGRAQKRETNWTMPASVDAVSESIHRLLVAPLTDPRGIVSVKALRCSSGSSRGQ